ncbi:YphA family membrane protein [Paenibacillus sp. strain BS8-2]
MSQLNPGYITVWMVLIIIILFATGWKPYLAPRVKAPTMFLLFIATTITLFVDYWWLLPADLPAAAIHSGTALWLVASLIAWVDNSNSGERGYLFICVLMLAIIWGSIRSLFAQDPVLYWIEPSWNAPLLCGLLSCMFTTNIRYQAASLLWSAVLGDVISAWLDKRISPLQIGSASWWDSLCIAIAVACCGAISIHLVRRVLAMAGRTWITLRDGRE